MLERPLFYVGLEQEDFAGSDGTAANHHARTLTQVRQGDAYHRVCDV
jgi:hypothetical protein